MKHLLQIFATILLTISPSWAVKIDPITLDICSEESLDVIQKKMTSINKFHLIDDSLFETDYWQANLIKSEFKAKDQQDNRYIVFAIKPAPVIGFGPTKFFPRFTAKCSFETSNQNLHLNKLHCDRDVRFSKFAIDAFVLDFSIDSDNNKCADKLALNVSVEVTINDRDYEEIVKRANQISPTVADEMGGIGNNNAKRRQKTQKKFFSTYFKTFLKSWESEDWQDE